MRKFTIVTVLLTVIVVVMSSEVFVDKYLPGLKTATSGSDDMQLTLPNKLTLDNSAQANVLGADLAKSNLQSSAKDETYEDVEIPLDTSTIDTSPIIPGILREDTTTAVPVLRENVVPAPIDTSSPSDFESENFNSAPQSVLIREDQVKSAGFVNVSLETESTNGYLFKSIFIDDIADVKVLKTSIKSGDQSIAKVYVFQIGPLNSLEQVYELLKLRASEGLNIEINETNTFGSSSFYMNDNQRQNVAFLLVKIGDFLYGFSYPKEYHAQIKNLVALLDMEF